jgi:hypothetical protein
MLQCVCNLFFKTLSRSDTRISSRIIATKTESRLSFLQKIGNSTKLKSNGSPLLQIQDAERASPSSTLVFCGWNITLVIHPQRHSFSAAAIEVIHGFLLDHL